MSWSTEWTKGKTKEFKFHYQFQILFCMIFNSPLGKTTHLWVGPIEYEIESNNLSSLKISNNSEENVNFIC